MLPFRSRRAGGIFGAILFFGLTVCSFGPGVEAQATPPQSNPVPPQPSVPTISVTTHEVLLEVVVTDASGNPVTGLKATDFTVTEEGTPQVIRWVGEHQPMPAADVARLNAAPVLPPNTFTNFTPVANTNAWTVLVLDALDTSIVDQMFLRERLIHYLRHMQPGALIAIIQFDTEVRLIQGFTSDQKALLAAMESKRNMPSLAGPPPGERHYVPLRQTFLKSDMWMLNTYLARFPGRKNLIWFTGGFPENLFGDNVVVDPGALLQVTRGLAMNDVAVYPVDVGGGGLQGFPQFSAAYSGVPLPHEFMGFVARQTYKHFNFDDVAAQTGGKAYYDTNGFGKVIDEVLRNGSNYYTLAYATTNKLWAGEFRRIKITVDRPRVRLQYPAGYVARTATSRSGSGGSNQSNGFNLPLSSGSDGLVCIDENTSTATQNGEWRPSLTRRIDASQGGDIQTSCVGRKRFRVAMALGAVAPTDIVFIASLLPDDRIVKLDEKSPLPPLNYLQPAWQHKPCRNYTILFYAEAQHINLTKTRGETWDAKVEFVAVAYNAKGEPVNSLTATVPFSVDEAGYHRLLEHGFTFRERIAIPVKGNYFLRLGVHDLIGDQSGVLEIPVDQIMVGVAGAWLP